MDKHLSLSFELIYLMGWLLKHEKGMLNSLIKHALKNGLAQDLEKVPFDEHGEASQELQSIILEFLAFLERSLAKNLDASHDDMHHSDQKQPDAQEIKLRLQRAKQLLAKEFSTRNHASDEKIKEPRKDTLDQVLKTWKPSKHDLVH